MTTKSSRLLVIDASIAHASGEVSEHPVSKVCRDTLYEILKICHRMVETQDVREEWKKHASNYAKRWRAAMARRGKIEFFPDGNTVDLDQETLGLSDNEFAALEKDMRLIEAAWLGDKIILTLDEKIQTIYEKCKTKLSPPVRWKNPIFAFEENKEWLWKL